MKRVASFVFGRSQAWERTLVVARIMLIAVTTLILYGLMQSPWKSLVAPLFWIFAAVVVASIAYQYSRRSREQRKAAESESNP